MRKMSDYLNGSKAAEFLGISVFRLRVWTRKGIIKRIPSPLTGKPMYLKEDLEEFLRGVQAERS